MQLADFLTTVPPGVEVQVEALFARHYPSSQSAVKEKVAEPDIKIHCDSDKCQGERYFRAVSTATVVLTHFKKHEDVFLKYECRNCSMSKNAFALRVVQEENASTDGRAVKFGEVPPDGPPVPSKVISLIGPDREMFLRGRRAENQGLGIGAFAYYRRVVENQKGRLIQEMGKVSEKLGSTPEVQSIFERAARETQFSKAVEEVKTVIPPVLLINGHNPLTLLHGALSEGLHAKTEEQCLEMATSIRVVLTELSERLSTALKDEAELERALKTLMRR